MAQTDFSFQARDGIVPARWHRFRHDAFDWKRNRSPWWRDVLLRRMLAGADATAGLLVFCIALIILELKKIELADYLPSLAFAPLLAWWWR